MHITNSAALYFSSNKRVKRITAIGILILIIVFSPQVAFADEDEGPDVAGAIEALDLADVDDLLYDTGISKDLSTGEVMKKIIDSGYDINVILECLNISSWFDEVKKVGTELIVTLIFIMLCCALVNSIGNKESNQIVETITVVFAILLSTSAIKDCANAAVLIYAEIERFSSVMVPIMCTILTIMGGVGTAGLIQAMIMVVNTTLLEVIDTLVMPLIMVLLVIGMIAPLSSREWLNSIRDTVSSFLKWGLGLTITVVATVFSLRGMSVAASDGIMLKTAEYAISDLVPVVGGSISKITGVIIGGMVMVKNAFGSVAIIILIVRCTSPMLVILMYMIVYKLAKAVADMFQNKKMSMLCSSISKGLTLYMAVCISVMVIVIVIVISSVGAANKIMAFA